ncbi:MAG: thioredoxin [Pyrinomonadaceae bacterium]|nr:thioredoxin [Pyrinomonadaceae bacterium]
MRRRPLIRILMFAVLGANSCATQRIQKPSNRPVASPGLPATHGTATRVVQITDASFNAEVLRSSTPVLIQFWAPWSAPDRMMAPIMEAVAIEYLGRVKVAKVDVDENAQLAKKFEITAIPTLVVIENGSEQERIVGATSKEAIARILDQRLGTR